MNLARFSVPGQPQGKGRAKAFRFGNHVKMHTPEKTVAYENWVKQCALDSVSVGFVPTDKPIIANVTMYYQKPKSGSKVVQSGRDLGTIRPTVKPDIDNVLKAIFDSLNGILYKDDTQIVEVTASKFYSDIPRVEVEFIYF